MFENFLINLNRISKTIYEYTDVGCGMLLNTAKHIRELQYVNF